MLLALQILFGVLVAGTGVGLVTDIVRNRMDELKNVTGKLIRFELFCYNMVSQQVVHQL